MNFSAVILAEGESKRMGRDKASIEFNGHSLLSLAVEKVRQLGITEVFISGRAEKDYSTLNCPVLLDLGPPPSAGLAEASACNRSEGFGLSVILKLCRWTCPVAGPVMHRIRTESPHASK